MPTYRQHRPQLTDAVFLTGGGIETTFPDVAAPTAQHKRARGSDDR